MKPPAFQFYVDDFLGGTMHFSNDEVGLYIRLLCVQWSVGSLPDDDAELASYGKGGTPIQRVKAKFFKGQDGRLRNLRLELERQKQEAFRQSRVDNGKRGGRPRKPSAKLSVLKTKAKISSPSPISVSDLPSPASDLQSPTVVGNGAVAHRPRFEKPTLEAMKLQGAKIGLPDSESEGCFNHYESNGWMVGRNPMRNWPAAMQNWKRTYESKRYQSGGGNHSTSSRPLTGAEQRTVGHYKPKHDPSELPALLAKQRAANEAARNGVAAPPTGIERNPEGGATHG